MNNEPRDHSYMKLKELIKNYLNPKGENEKYLEEKLKNTIISGEELIYILKESKEKEFKLKDSKGFLINQCYSLIEGIEKLIEGREGKLIDELNKEFLEYKEGIMEELNELNKNG